jgi:glutamate dehydrogenase
MTGTSADERPDSATPAADTVEAMTRAFRATYRGPHDDMPGAHDALAEPAAPSDGASSAPAELIRAHYRLAGQRHVGEILVQCYGADDPDGFGPAIQVVTDQGPMLIDSITVLLHRLGVAYRAIMNPVFRVRRDAAGTPDS